MPIFPCSYVILGVVLVARLAGAYRDADSSFISMDAFGRLAWEKRGAARALNDTVGSFDPRVVNVAGYSTMLAQLAPKVTFARGMTGGFIQTSVGASAVKRVASTIWAHGEPTRPKPEEMTFSRALLAAITGTITMVVFTTFIGFFYHHSSPNRVPMGRPDPEVDGKFTSWSSGVCGCFADLEVCCCSMCCYPVRWAMTMSFVPGLLTFWLAFFLVVVLQTGNHFVETIITEYVRTDWEVWAWEQEQFQGNATGWDWDVFWPKFQKQVEKEKMIPHEHRWLEVFMNVCCLLSILLPMFYRQKLRQTFGMPVGGATFITDFCLHLCCSCCAIAQEARHVELARKSGHEALVGQAVGVGS